METFSFGFDRMDIHFEMEDSTKQGEYAKVAKQREENLLMN